MVVVAHDAPETVVMDDPDTLVGVRSIAHYIPGADGLIPGACVLHYGLEGSVVAMDVGEDEEPHHIGIGLTGMRAFWG